ncbi:unnamed protein product [Owenia fusiformis]|uniref:Fibronectin type-III domain-containing protein n=1 Tax=Owenia fusiformis TaxID=6347 RepID=A0A8S4PLE5_OWEFU|nr:unnamed protein product [Owenia fusiformis]
MPFEIWALNIKAYFKDEFLVDVKAISPSSVKVYWAHGKLGIPCICSEAPDSFFTVQYKQQGEMLYKIQRVDSKNYAIIQNLLHDTNYEFIVEDRNPCGSTKRFTEKCVIKTKKISYFSKSPERENEPLLNTC